MSVEVRSVEGNLGRRSPAIRDPGKHVKKAIQSAAKGDFDEAIQALHEVTKSRPDYFQAWTAKAVLYRLIGDEKMALLCARTARSLKPKE